MSSKSGSQRSPDDQFDRGPLGPISHSVIGSIPVSIFIFPDAERRYWDKFESRSCIDLVRNVACLARWPFREIERDRERNRELGEGEYPYSLVQPCHSWARWAGEIIQLQATFREASLDLEDHPAVALICKGLFLIIAGDVRGREEVRCWQKQCCRQCRCTESTENLMGSGVLFWLGQDHLGLLISDSALIVICYIEQRLEPGNKLFHPRKHEYKSSRDRELTENLMGSGGLFWLGQDSSGFGLLMIDCALITEHIDQRSKCWDKPPNACKYKYKPSSGREVTENLMDCARGFHKLICRCYGRSSAITLNSAQCDASGCSSHADRDNPPHQTAPENTPLGNPLQKFFHAFAQTIEQLGRQQSNCGNCPWLERILSPKQIMDSNMGIALVPHQQLSMLKLLHRVSLHMESEGQQSSTNPQEAAQIYVTNIDQIYGQNTSDAWAETDLERPGEHRPLERRLACCAHSHPNCLHETVADHTLPPSHNQHTPQMSTVAFSSKAKLDLAEGKKAGMLLAVRFPSLVSMGCIDQAYKADVLPANQAQHLRNKVHNMIIRQWSLPAGSYVDNYALMEDVGYDRNSTELKIRVMTDVLFAKAFIAGKGETAGFKYPSIEIVPKPAPSNAPQGSPPQYAIKEKQIQHAGAPLQFRKRAVEIAPDLTLVAVLQAVEVEQEGFDVFSEDTATEAVRQLVSVTIDAKLHKLAKLATFVNKKREAKDNVWLEKEQPTIALHEARRTATMALKQDLVDGKATFEDMVRTGHILVRKTAMNLGTAGGEQEAPVGAGRVQIGAKSAAKKKQLYTPTVLGVECSADLVDALRGYSAASGEEHATFCLPGYKKAPDGAAGDTSPCDRYVLRG